MELFISAAKVAEEYSDMNFKFQYGAIYIKIIGYQDGPNCSL